MNRPSFRRTLRRTVASVCILGLVACDNVGRAFDPGGGGGGGGGEASATTISAAEVGGTVFDGRPKVRATFPTGAGWAITAPVVVIFNESINEDLAVPAQGEPLIFCRVKGTTQRLTTGYNFLQGGSVVLMRPLPAWPPAQQQATIEIEVVVSPELRDTDGIRLGSTGDPIVVGTFTPDADLQAAPDGRIVTTIPEDAGRDQPREVPLYLVFDRPPTPNSVTLRNFTVSDGSGAAITGTVSAPIIDAGVADTRIAQFVPTGRLPADSEVRITVDDTITFANDGKLDFLGRSPFTRFRTLPFASANVVALANPMPGLVNKINRANLESAQMEVTLPSDSRSGDEVVVRVYGLERRTEPPGDVNFVEARQAIEADGVTRVIVPLPNLLGTVDAPRFGDGPATFAVRVRRAARTSGWSLAEAANEPVIDIGLPTLTSIGPPSLAGSSLDLIVDQEFVTLYGTATERISAATVAVLGTTTTNFGTTTGGRFMLRPLALGRASAPIAYTLTLTDAAGNESQPITGTVTQRGGITGALAGTLVVEAFDDATLRPIAGALISIEPGMPQKPAVGRESLNSGADGRAMFSALGAANYSVTVVAPGYHMKSLLTTAASFVSLGLRPQVGATATLQGAVLLGMGVAAGRVGCNAFDDDLLDMLAPSAQFLLPPTPIRPGRLLVIMGLGGTFSALGNGALSHTGCLMCGVSGFTATPALVPAVAGAASTAAVSIAVPSVGATTPYMRDFAASTGLLPIVDGPSVRVAMSMLGISGTTTFGVGVATPGGSTTAFNVTSSYSRANTEILAPLSPVLWVSLEARDAPGNVARHRSLVTDFNAGTTLGTWPTPGIPTIALPGGASSGAPSVTYEDRLSGSIIPGGLAMTEMIATDAAGRTWSILREDRTGLSGTTTWQLPDLSGTSAVGLAAGTWRVRARETLAFSITALPGDFLLEELRRAEVTMGRSNEVAFTVN